MNHLNKEEKITSEFSKNRPLYEAFSQKIKELIFSVLKEKKIDVHSIEFRTKEVSKLREKVSREGKQYDKYTDVTDLSGVRIICFSTNQLETVCKSIKENFEIIEELSVDKKTLLDPDRFGYLSIHYVVKLSKQRNQLPEYATYADLICEIQIRTLLQHAWAEIEHDLGYKSDIAVPKHIKRRFYRLSGLLELADDEFNFIIKEIESYKQKLEQMPEHKIELDAISLKNYIENSSIINQINEETLKVIKNKTKIVTKTNKVELYLRILNFYSINNLATLSDQLNKHAKEIPKYIDLWIRADAGDLDVGISIFYLGYILAGESGDKDFVEQYLEEMRIGLVGNMIALVNRILETTKKAKEE